MLPCEVIATLLQNLDNVRDLAAARLLLYLGPLRYSAWYFMLASCWFPLSHSVAFWPTQLTSRLHNFTLGRELNMGRMHIMVHDFTDELAIDASTLLSYGDSYHSDNLSLCRT